MRKIADYLQHAQECRDLARTAQGEMRDKLLQMAQTWETLAQDRQRKGDDDDGNPGEAA